MTNEENDQTAWTELGSARFDHIVIVTEDLDRTSRLYEAILGEPPSKTTEATHEGYRASVFQVEPSGPRLEICEPTCDVDGPPGGRAFLHTLRTKGEGLHYIAFEVPDIVCVTERMREAGLRLMASKYGRSVFVHPDSAGGVLLLLRQI